MSKIVKYLVTVEGNVSTLDTLREVSDVLGRKVTKAMINKGEVPEVEVLSEDLVEDERATDDGVARVYKGDGEYEEMPLTNPVGNQHNSEEEQAMETNKTELITAEEESKIEEIINGTDDKEEISDVGDYVEEHTDNGEVADEDTTEEDSSEDTTDEENNDDNTEDDDTSEGNSKMSSLLEKMRALNAKKATEAGSQPATTKGKRTKTVQFTGEFPEVGFFKEKKVLQKFYKQLTDEQLDDWLSLEGLTYKPSENEPINRMRKCMAILALHFPPETKTTKKKSKYADYTTEQLLEMALDNDIEVPEGKGDERILRMYTIMALRKAGIIE